MNSKFSSIEKAFYSDGYNLVMKAIEHDRHNLDLMIPISEMYAEIDNLIRSLQEYAIQQNQTIDCKKGCSWCCYQPVFALDYELDFMKNHIRQNFTPEKQRKIQKRAIEKFNKLDRLTSEELHDSKHPCPLLEDGACISYSARPMACRIYLSSSLKTCYTFYTNPKDKTSYPSLLDFPMRAGRMMNEGFKAALKTNGIVAEEFRIEEKLKD